MDTGNFSQLVGVQERQILVVGHLFSQLTIDAGDGMHIWYTMYLQPAHRQRPHKRQLHPKMKVGDSLKYIKEKSDTSCVS